MARIFEFVVLLDARSLGSLWATAAPLFGTLGFGRHYGFRIAAFYPLTPRAADLPDLRPSRVIYCGGLFV